MIIGLIAEASAREMRRRPLDQIIDAVARLGPRASIRQGNKAGRRFKRYLEKTINRHGRDLITRGETLLGGIPGKSRPPAD